MGFYGTVGATKADIIADVTNDESEVRADGTARTRSVIAQSLRGNDLWTVERVAIDGVERRRQIVVYHLGYMPGSNGFGAGWGYKPESEEMGPVTSSCPLKFFALVPKPPNDDGARWRERVHAFHAERAMIRTAVKRASVGTTYLLPTDAGWKIPQFVLIRTKPMVGAFEGRSYRVSARALAAATVRLSE